MWRKYVEVLDGRGEAPTLGRAIAMKEFIFVDGVNMRKLIDDLGYLNSIWFSRKNFTWWELYRYNLYTINQNSPIVKALKKSQHDIMFYDAEIVAQEQVEKGIVLEIKREKVDVWKKRCMHQWDAPEFQRLSHNQTAFRYFYTFSTTYKHYGIHK